jgi:hypothetical protein
MSSRRIWIGFMSAASLWLYACSAPPAPVPVVGFRPDVSALSGSWSGEYSSFATGRRGTIEFTLAAAADTAYGEILMLPMPLHYSPPNREGHGSTLAYPIPNVSSTIAIEFVLVADDSVTGRLESYQDPLTGDSLMTDFMGRLKGDRIAGSYVTRDLRTREVTSGEWEVRRRPVNDASP